VTYTVQAIGGAPNTYTIELAKPNLAKIDSVYQLITADGANITTYDKKLKTYYKKKQTDAEVAKLLSNGDFMIWLPFFDNTATTKFKAIRSLGTKVRKNVTYQAVEFVLQGGQPTKVTYYLSNEDFIARQAEFSAKNLNVIETIIFNTQKLSVGAENPDVKKFAFVAPTGSRELSEAELNAGKWYTSIDEALEVAKSTNKVVLAYFGTDW
jgi:outer membrane lipoprotein-sorting protein